MDTGTGIGRASTIDFTTPSYAAKNQTGLNSSQNRKQIESAAKDLLKSAGSPEKALELVKGAVELMKNSENSQASTSGFSAEQMQAAQSFVRLASPEMAIEAMNGAIQAMDPGKIQQTGMNTIAVA